MNITPSMIYWLTRLDEFRILLGIIFACVVIVAITNVVGGFIAMDMAHDNRVMSYGNKNEVPSDEARMRTRFTRAAKFGIVALLIGVANSFLPSTKQAAALIVIPKIATSEIVAEMGDTAKELVCLAKSWLIELKPQSKTENKEVKK